MVILYLNCGLYTKQCIYENKKLYVMWNQFLPKGQMVFFSISQYVLSGTFIIESFFDVRERSVGSPWDLKETVSMQNPTGFMTLVLDSFFFSFSR